MTTPDAVRADASRRVARAASAARAAHRTVASQANGKPGPWTDLLHDLRSTALGCAPVLAWLDNAVFCFTYCLAEETAACAKLVASPKSAIPALVNARASLEASGQLAYLIETRDETLSRATLLALQDTADEAGMIEWAAPRGLADADPGGNARAISEAAAALGFEIMRSRWGGIRGLKGAEGAEIPLPSATQMIKQMADAALGPDARAAWMISSGMAHSRPWATTHEIKSPNAPYLAAAALTAATTAISSVAIAIDHVGRVFGDDSLRGVALELRMPCILLGEPPL